MKLFLCTVSMIVVVTVNCHGPTPAKPPDSKPPQPEHQPQATNSPLKSGYLNATTLVTNGTSANDFRIVAKLPSKRQRDTSCQCGIINKSRIVGGTEVHPKRKYPWQIGLVFLGNSIHCGGTIINDRWILSAAHCITHENTCNIKWSSTIRVTVGDHHQFQTNDDDSNTKKYKIKKCIIHYNYDCGRNFDFDFALIELKEAIPFNNRIRPVCLPKDDSKTYVGYTGTVTGWGRTSTNGPKSHFLREVQVPICANNNCGIWQTLAAMKLCAGGEVGKDSCGGDSGGPLLVEDNNKCVQVGVVSYGHASAGCASTRYPGVYARVSKVIPWITTTTASGKKCD